MTTSHPPCLAALALLALLATGTAHAQPIEADSQDALELPGARQYAPPPGRDAGVPARRGQYRGQATYGSVSPDLPASLPPQHEPGVQVPYGGYGANGYGGGYGGAGSYGGASGYNGASGYGGTYAGTAFGGSPSDFGAGTPAFVAPFGGGPGGQTPIPLGAGSLYSGSAVNGTAVGPQFSSQLPAYQGRSRR